MSIKLSRIIFIVCLVWVFYWNVNKMVVGYALLMWASSEILNSNKIYKQLPHYKLYNAMFIGLLIFTTIDRSRHFFVIMNIWEYVINAVEHFLFTLVVSLLISVFTIAFYRKNIKPLLLVTLAALAFNSIGLINEFYQNYFKNHEDLWAIDFESKIDLLVNFISSIICIGWVYFFPKYFPTIREAA